MDKTRIIVDAMGGDNAPDSVVRGAVRGAVLYETDLILVGISDKIKKILETVDTSGVKIDIHHADSVVEMDDDPSVVMREKKDSSMVAAANLLKDGGGDVLISAGNTGALFSAATLYVRRHKGVRRAALGAVIPLTKPFIIVDSGANTDVSPELLLQFAKMGSLYCENILNIKNPSVALLNNGSEETKGTEIYREAYGLLKESGMNFIGNCEGRDVPFGFCDVLACDGFTGNILLKTIEGMAKFMSDSMKSLFYRNTATKIAGLMTKGSIKDLKKRLNHKEYGGAPFLGISKPVIKSHGSADEMSIISTIRQGDHYHKSGLNDKIARGLLIVEDANEKGE